jgi:uncharacterized protein involved in outer membrane biogenesis
LFVVIGGFVVAVLIAALVAPLFIDWTGYRADFEREASKILGRPVKVAGEAKARILPFPSLAFTNVRVGEDIENPALTIEQFSMDAELAPFLSGEVLIFDMRVTKPRGIIVIDKSGKIDWTLRPNSPFNPGNVRIENMVVEGGQFDLVDEAAGRTHRIALPEAAISAKALTGPWRMSAMAQVDGEPVKVMATTGQAGEGALPVHITALPTMRSVVIESDGSAKAQNGRVSYAGRFTLRPALKSDLVTAGVIVTDRLSDEKTGALFKVKGKFGLASTGLALPEFKLETGARDKPYVANGSGSLIFGASPMFDLKLAGTQVNFAATQDASAGSGLGSRVETLRQFISSVPLPAMPGSIDVNLPAIVAGDTTIRAIAFTATPENGAWRVRNFKSTLPGRTQLEADGLLGRGKDFGFTGKLLVASNQPAGLANWLTGQVDPAIRKLSAIGFSSSVDLKPDVQRFDALELALGDATLTGQAERRSDGMRPALTLGLSGGALHLDALTALSEGLAGTNGVNRFAGYDVNLTLDAGPVSHNGIEAAKIGVSLRMKADAIEIDRLMLTDIAGASISATGKVDDPDAMFPGNIDASLVSADGGEFIAMLAQRFPDNSFLQTFSARIATVPGFLSDLHASLIANTAKDAGVMAISLNAKTASGELVVSGYTKGADIEGIAGDFQGSLREQDPLNLVALAGVPLVPLGAPGPAMVEFSGSGDMIAGLNIAVKVNAAGTDAHFDGTVQKGGAGVVSSGVVSLMSDDFDVYLTAAGLVYPGVGTGTPLQFKSSIKSDATGVYFAGINGAVRDNKISGNMGLTSGVRPKISGTIRADRLDMNWFAQNLFGTGIFDATDGLVGRVAFSTQPVAPFDGRVDFSSGIFGLAPWAEAHEAKGAIILSANSVRLENLNASLAGGVLSGGLEMWNDGGSGAISANFSLQNGQTGTVAVLKPISGTVDIRGSMTAGGKTVDAMISGLTGSGIAAIKDGAVSGLNPDGFASLIATFQPDQDVPTDRHVEAMIASFVRTGSFPLNEGNLAWSIAGGKLRMAGIKGKAAGAVLNGDVTADFAIGNAVVTGAVAYDAGKEAVAGADPTVPFVTSVSVDQSSMVTDEQPLLQYLTRRALEREQARVEALQSALVEKQRLRRDVRLIGLLYAERDRRSMLRETAVRAEAAHKGAVFALQWKAEKARLDGELIKQKAATKVKADLERAAAEKAAQDAAVQLRLEETPEDGLKRLENAFKSLDLN